MKKFSKRSALLLIGMFSGAVAGYFYQQQNACTTGCLITSSPTFSILYGGLLGALFVSLFRSPSIKN